MGTHGRRTARLGLALAALGIAACSSVADPTKYYVLAQAPPAATSARQASADTGPTIGVGPVSVPGYLDRTQVVTRGAGDEVDVSMYHRWAEPLESGIAQALASELAARMGTERVAVFPWRGTLTRVLDYQVAVAVVRFDGTPGRDVTLDARWRVVDKDGREVAAKRSTIVQPVSGGGYPPLVAGMNQALGGLGREIAAEIQAASGKRAAGGS